MSDSAFTPERRFLFGSLLAFVGVSLLAAFDISADLREGTTMGHVVIEGGILLVALLGAAFMTRRLVLTLRRARATQKEALALVAQLEETRAEA
ncbi:MAG: hypothetical protein JSV06_11955, partial [Myxococcales bacterium]